jgi:cell division transport system permease protein
MRPQFFLAEIWTGFRRNATLTIAMVVNMAIALSLIGNAVLVRKQTDVIRDYFYGQLQVTVYLCGPTATEKCHSETTVAQRDQIESDLHAMPQVADVQFETQEQAYERFKKFFASQPALVALTTPDTLPPNFRVKLRNPQDYTVVRSAFEGRPGVDNVTDFSKVLNFFTTTLNKLQLFAWAVGLAALVGGILLVLNSTLVAAHSRRRELGIMRLVGAPNYYIRLPFLVQSAISGLIGCALATIALFVEQKLVLSFDLTKSAFSLPFPLVGRHEILGTLPLMLLTAVVLAVVTSWLSLVRYLRV